MTWCRILGAALTALNAAALCLMPALAEGGEPVAQAKPTVVRVAQDTAAGKLVGTWRLVSIEERNAEGQLVMPLDYGPDPVGILMYDSTGHMSAHAMRRGRPRFDSDDVHRATPDEAKAAFVGYNGYFGTYEIDLRAGVVIHHVQGSSIPNWEGSQQRRRFTISGDTLVLEPPEFQAAGQKRFRRLTWQRVQ